jgi:uncharacterized Fe-S cluster-containing radical SAM superfamily protein
MKGYNPIEVAKRLRPKMIDLEAKKVLLANFSGTSQSADFAKRHLIGDWARKKIYLKPKEKNLPDMWKEPAGVASRNMNVPPDECNATFTIQVKGCNLACWFCYVDDENKDGRPEKGIFVSAEEILTRFLVESRKCQYVQNPDEKVNIIRISGGEVSIVPEIILWLIEAIENYGLENNIYLWADTNLTTLNTFWGNLSRQDIEKIVSFRNFGIVGCYKGIDPESYHDNTGADPDTWMAQFLSHRLLVDMGFDVYSYLVPTIFLPDDGEKYLEQRLRNFIMILQHVVDPVAAGRLYPLEIKNYSPMGSRLTPEREKALELHWKVREYLRKIQREYYGNKLDCSHEIPTKIR